MSGRLAERIRQCAARLGSGDELARATGIPRRTLEYYLSGEREPKASRCVEIARAAGVLPGWLVSGEGPQQAAADAHCDHGSQCLQIPLRPAGHDVPDSGLSLPAAWLGRAQGSANLQAVRVEGDGMEPTLRSSDILVIDCDCRRIQDGQLFAIRDQDTLLIKRLQSTLGGKVRIISDNPRYPEFETSATALEIIGRVVWKCGPL